MEKNYDFRARMCEVHRPYEASASRPCPEGYLDLSCGVAVILPDNADAVLSFAATDFCDYLRTSQATRAELGGEGIPVRLLLSSGSPETAPSGNEERAYRIIVRGDEVVVTANTGKGIFAATVYLEELMSETKCPALAYGDIDRRPIFTPRMVHSGYALDEFPEEYMNRLAHDGYDTLLVFVKGANLAPRGEVDFNALIDTAACYGLDVYAYSYIVSEKHPDDEGAEEYYESTYGNLFKTSPGFRGVVFVGESCEFPSRDERAYPWLHRYHPKGKPVEKFFARNFPVRDYPEWLSLVKRIIRKYSPECDVLFWSYNWGYCPAKDRVALIDTLPLDISLQATFEMYESLPAPEGVSEMTTDYTIAIPGPGSYFLSEAEAAHRRGLRLYTISNTAGTTWDIGIVPFIPAPEIWGERYDKLIECHEKYGLSGLMEGHHYGAYHSFISELSKEMGWSPRRDFREHMRAIAAREYGEENVDDVISAWHHASEGCRHNVPTVEDQYGPLRVGPAYPLVTKTKWVMPSAEWAHFGGNRITYTGYGQYGGFPGGDCLCHPRRVLHEITEFETMRRELDRAAEIFTAVAERLSGRARVEAGRMTAHLFLMARSAETVVNVKRFSLLRRAAEEMCGVSPLSLLKSDEWQKASQSLYGTADLTPSTILDLCRTIAEAECENARQAIPAVEYDSRLGWEASMEYMCDREHLLWKIECTQSAFRELEELLSPIM